MLTCPASIAHAQSSSRQLDLSLPPNVGAGNSRSDQELDIGAAPTPIERPRGWQLETGSFRDDSPSARLKRGQGEGPLDTYSGIRLRAPLQGVP